VEELVPACPQYVFAYSCPLSWAIKAKHTIF
jgi:hypothetical protein